MTNLQYKRPPITEAIIEIRLKEALSELVVKKIHDRLQKKYVSSEEISVIGIRLNPVKQELEKMPAEFSGFKLTSNDQADVLLVKPNAMACSRLAPYNGWENFEERARANWEEWRKAKKRLQLDRIGVRYINRIDIPLKDEEAINIENYLNIFPKYPEPSLLKSFSQYAMHVRGPFYIEDFILTINTNVVKSPLIDHLSIVLDLDLSPDGDLPQRNDQVWKMINKMREYKNNAFEMCVTDKARELFM